MKRIFLFCVTILLVTFGIVVFGPSFVNWGAYKDQIVALVSDKAGLKIEIKGGLGGAIVPTPHIYIENASILSPHKDTQEQEILSFERFDLYVSLASLLQGKVAVDSITLVKPVVNIESMKDGSLNISKLLTGVNKEKAANDTSASSSQEDANSTRFMDLSVDLIRIKDGSFRYFDRKTNQKHDIKNINTDISLESLKGPYALEGSFFYDHYSWNVNGKIKDVDLENKTLLSDVTFKVHPLDVEVSYAGAVDFATQELTMQGPFKVQLADLASAEKILSSTQYIKKGAPLDVSGLLTYDGTNLRFDNIEATLAQIPFDISSRILLSPLSLEAKVKSKQPFLLDTILDQAPVTQKVDLDLKLKADRKILEISDAIVKLGDQPFSVAGKYNQKTQNSDFYVSAKINDVHKMVKGLSLDLSSVPKEIKKVDIKVKMSGALASPEIVANIDTQDLKIIAKGSIKQNSTIDKFIVQIKHPNTVNFLNQYGRVKLSNPYLNGPVDLYMQVQQFGKKYDISELSGKVAGTDISGTLSFDGAAQRLFINGDIVLGTLKLGGVSYANSSSQKGISPKGGDESQGAASSSARWSREPINISALKAVDAELTIKAKKIDYGLWPLHEPNVSFALKGGVLNINSLKANIYDGDIDFSSEIDASNSQEGVRFKSISKFKRADIGKVSTSLIGTKLVQISGKGDVDLSLNGQGKSVFDIIHSLSGQGSVNGNNIVLQGVDVVRFIRALSIDSKPGDTAAGLWKGSMRGGQTQFDTLEGAFSIQKGLVNIEKMDLDGARASIETRGQINLPKWTLATKHKLTAKAVEGVPSDVPPFEVEFSGSLDNPSQTFGQGLLQDYLNRKLQRKFNKLLSDKLGTPANDNQSKQEGGAAQEGGEPQQKTPPKDPLEGLAEDAIKGVLDGLLR